MKPFHTIAIPHKDILEGKLTLDTFAADLWQVYKNEAPTDYKNSEEFFRKTFITKGLKNLLNIIHKRLNGQGGDPVIQLQTPFGGGKTHTLIAAYHKANEWNAKTIVIVGTPLEGNVRLWEIFEKQLTGEIKELKSSTSPGRDKLKSFLEKHQPLLILMDEILEYVTKAAGVKVGDSTLAAQTLAFMQELTEAVASLNNTILLITLPSSIMEHYDENAERLFQQLQKISGRVEKIYTPVEDDEITEIIRKRLFSSINEDEALKIIDKFIGYLESENILPSGLEASEYRELFKKSYPFIPEVIKILYERWGSYPNFQRTRGVLQLLALVIFNLKDKNIPYISVSDFDLSITDLKNQLIKHSGNQFESVISSDITSKDSGAKKVDNKLGASYKGLKIGTRAANSIFLYSFSGGDVKGATKNEIKRVTANLDIPSSVIGDALEELKNNLFYLQYINEKYFFSAKPNLNRIILTKMDNISDNEIDEEEYKVLKSFINTKFLKLNTYIWIKDSSDIPDNSTFKLIILKELNEKIIHQIIENKGNSPRVYKNTIFFLIPQESKKSEVSKFVKKIIAYRKILNDNTLNLERNENMELTRKLKELENDFFDIIRNYYKILYIPDKNKNFKKEDIGSSIYGASKKLNEEVYEVLLSKKEIIQNISPLVIESKYLQNNDVVKISQIYDSSLSTPGEIRFKDIDVLLNGIKLGVKQGNFGIGKYENETIKCLYFNEEIENVDENLFIIKEDLCKEKQETLQDEQEGYGSYGTNIHKDPQKIEAESFSETPLIETEKKINSMRFKFTLPKGKALEIGKLLNFLDRKFNDISISIESKSGSISEQEFDNVVKETLFQLGIKDAIKDVK